MKKQLIALCAASLMALSMSSCGGDDDNNSKDKTCGSDFKSYCKSNFAYVTCQDGVEKTETCASCKDDVCTKNSSDPTPTEDKCKDFKNHCDGDKLIVCRDNKETTVDCAKGCDAEKNACVPDNNDPIKVCSFEGTQCSMDGKQVLTCINGYEHAEDCEFGCFSNACASGCSFTGNGCNDDYTGLTECKDGKVVDVKTCEYGCDKGKCSEPCTKQEPWCSDDGKQAHTCRNGGDVVSDCPNGCTDGECNGREVECTAEPKCSDDGKTLIYCDGGVEKTQECTFGCDAEVKECILNDPEKICESDRCSKDGKNLLKCVDGVLEDASDSNKCDVKCVDDAMGDKKSACVNEDYCQKPEECAGREDGKTTCMYSERRCETYACSQAKCKEGETCVLGACVTKNDLEAKYNEVCDPNTFVEHCRDKDLFFCSKVTDTDYKVRKQECGFRGCYAYKSGVTVKSACAVAKDHKSCGEDKTNYRVCEDTDDMSWLTTYSCTLSTNAEEIVILEGDAMCDGLCVNESYCLTK